jgi:hypothetical protein
LYELFEEWRWGQSRANPSPPDFPVKQGKYREFSRFWAIWWDFRPNQFIKSAGILRAAPVAAEAVRELARAAQTRGTGPGGQAALQLVFIVLHHERRHIVHFGVTAHSTSLWASQQIREAFPCSITAAP